MHQYICLNEPLVKRSTRCRSWRFPSRANIPLKVSELQVRLVILILPIVKLVDSVVLLVERKFIAPVFEIKFSPDPIEILPVMFVDVHIVADAR